MKLPEFLTSDDRGYIRATGHRIGLHHVVRLYEEGYSPEMIAAQYPSLSLALVHKIIAFYLENTLEVKPYVAEHDREFDRQVAQARPGPTAAELRTRFQVSRGI